MFVLLSMEKLVDLFHSMKVLFSEYFQNILGYFLTTENISILWNWTKLWKLDFPTFFCNIHKILLYSGKGPIVPVLFYTKEAHCNTHLPSIRTTPDEGRSLCATLME